MPTMHFSIVFDLPARAHVPDEIPARWPLVLAGMLSMWHMGNSTELVTAFVHYFPKPLRP